jgi:hypothetical protein
MLLEDGIFCDDLVAVLCINETIKMEMRFVIHYQIKNLISILSKKFSPLERIYDFQNELNFIQKLYYV